MILVKYKSDHGALKLTILIALHDLQNTSYYLVLSVKLLYGLPFQDKVPLTQLNTVSLLQGYTTCSSLS
jgi:hypothetical protein